MAMGVVWFLLLTVGTVYAAVHGTVGAAVSGAMDGAKQGIQAAIALAGPLCLWSGAAAVMQISGISKGLSRWLSPLIHALFPKSSRDQKTMEALSGNITANLLGLGNAATPLGIQAVRRMKKGSTASGELCRFVVINTASLQLLPTTVAALRSSMGAAKPFDILPAVWLTSICALAAGLSASFLFEHLLKHD